MHAYVAVTWRGGWRPGGGGPAIATWRMARARPTLVGRGPALAQLCGRTEWEGEGRSGAACCGAARRGGTGARVVREGGARRGEERH